MFVAREGTFPDKSKQTISRLICLPLEILEQIVKHVHHISVIENKGIHGLWSQRKSQLAFVPIDKRSQRYIMQLDNRVPILNSLQSLSVVNRCLHDLCCRLLWETLRFPTRLPIPITLWINELLPKHGFRIRSLSLTLSTRFLKTPHNDPFRHNIHYDNTALRKEGVCRKHLESCNCFVREMLSPKSVMGLLDQCHGNLSDLDIIFSAELENRLENLNSRMHGLQLFFARLTPVMSRLSGLRHLGLRNIHFASFNDEVLSQMFSGLSLLESFSASDLPTWFVDHNKHPNHTGEPLSRLKNLLRLQFHQVSAVDESYCHHSWPKVITELHLEGCSNVNPTVGHQLIHRIAPNLTRLRLDFCNSVEDFDFGSNWQEKLQFQLPHLTDLNIQPYEHDYLTCFQECQNLQRLKCDLVAKGQWKYISHLVCVSTWPKLDKIDLYGLDIYESDDQLLDDDGIDYHQDLIREFCDQAGIVNCVWI
ncbi:uncharacterized protein MELLADRAFT_77573 [Melampsora larici-populina 98AG31]|uniref:F-box domain-containing protein n=1 Tax=Melampsora larici-populina (strain 98AG31 / pathotype 3-4-7) TaxID=747676 RepID=F4RJF9_MELLP|nr:uncharacterized protein MELLADRAFT_77573 [Melampsora larici-populina 98AG31]EGG07501.1 hypothetical protein MELLADRAFT_77573 [Melampsora larici-populina 98AG31]